MWARQYLAKGGEERGGPGLLDTSFEEIGRLEECSGYTARGKTGKKMECSKKVSLLIAGLFARARAYKMKCVEFHFWTCPPNQDLAHLIGG